MSITAAETSTIERLEKWNNGHKARWVNIERDDGYGSSCWTVTLGHERGITTAIEWIEQDGTEGEPAVGHVRVYGKDDWAGLDATINGAIDAVEKGIFGPKRKHG
jgi:hypothetical protein